MWCSAEDFAIAIHTHTQICARTHQCHCVCVCAAQAGATCGAQKRTLPEPYIHTHTNTHTHTHTPMSLCLCMCCTGGRHVVLSRGLCPSHSALPQGTMPKTSNLTKHSRSPSGIRNDASVWLSCCSVLLILDHLKLTLEAQEDRKGSRCGQNSLRGCLHVRHLLL